MSDTKIPFPNVGRQARPPITRAEENFQSCRQTMLSCGASLQTLEFIDDNVGLTFAYIQRAMDYRAEKEGC